MPNTIKLTVTQQLKDELRSAWTDEIANSEWDADEVARDIEKMETVPVGTVITATDEDERPEEQEDFDGSQYTPEQLIMVGWEYYGFPPAIAPYEIVAV